MLLNELCIYPTEKVAIWFNDDSEPVFDGYYEDWHYRDYDISLVWAINDHLCICLDKEDDDNKEKMYVNRLGVGVRNDYDNNHSGERSE